MKYDYLTLAEIIKNRREEKGYSTRKLGEITGVSHSEISRIENGLKPNFSFIILSKICNGLDINMDELLKEVGLLKKRTYFILIEDLPDMIMYVDTNNGLKDVEKYVNFLIDNGIIFDEKDNCGVRVSENIDDFKDDFPEEVEEFLKWYNNKNEKRNLEIYKTNSFSDCNNCIYYCPLCDENTYEE